MFLKRITTGMSAVCLVLTLAAAPVAAADDSSTDVSREVSEALTAIKNYSIEQKDAAVENGRELIDNIDARIDAMQAKTEAAAADASAETKDKWSESLVKLRELREAAEIKFAAMKDGTADAWDEVKADFGEAATALSEKVQAAQDEFDS